MPNGVTHDKITYIATPLVGLGTFALTNDPTATLAVTGAFLFSGLMFSGDLDLPSKQTYRWGPLRFLWKPYQRMFSHRSIWTHGVIVGPIVRILYLYLWFSAGLFLASLTPLFDRSFMELQKGIVDFLTIHKNMAVNIFIGFVLGAISHTGADLSVSWVKKNTKILRGRR